LEESGHESSARSGEAFANMKEIANESLRVANVAHNAPSILEDLDAEFERRTGLNAIDIAFLFVATALQCVRWYILTPFKERIGHKENSDKIKDSLAILPKKWQEILTSSVPFDAVIGSSELSLGLGSHTHRAKTLGHDPLLGWIFGTANILTGTITLSDFRSFHVASSTIIPGEQSTWEIVLCPAKTLLHGDLEEKASVGLALLREGVHLLSDVESNKSLPLPVINTVSFEFGQKIAKYGFDMANAITVGKQATLAVLINTIIASVHRLFYDETSGMNHKLYEVKTRKILSYSNLLATSSNLIYVTLGSCFGGPATLRKFDVGGAFVTIYRLFTDVKFIHKLKREFIMESFNEMIRSETYSFEK
jgi:hypothetical protein